VLPSIARCRLPRPDREVLSITALDTNRETGLTDDDAASPELALVDSKLRERLAQAPPVPPPAPAPRPAPDVVRPAPRSRPRHRLRIAVLLSLALLAAGGSAWYWLARPGSPATRSAAAAPRVFAWAAVRGVSAYDLEIRRNGVVIYAARTARPRLQMPARWVRNGTTMTLAAGTYQWYVWPVLRGSQIHEPAAIVAASFRVGP